MHCRRSTPSDASAIESLFASVFTASEGPPEGALIGALVRTLLAETDPDDLDCFVAIEGGDLVGAICFSRLTVATGHDIFMLAPVAVATERHGQGIGQTLIRFGLRALSERGVSVAVTYGDPAFYGRTGFQPLSSDVLAAPFELSQPEGWFGQSLSGDPIPTIPGRAGCVPAFRDPAFW